MEPVRARNKNPDVMRIALRCFLGGAAVLIVVVTAVVLIQKLKFDVLVLVIAVGAGLAGLWFNAVEAARKAVAEQRHYRLYRLFRLMNRVLRHDIGGKLANVRYGIEASGIKEDEDITMAYESAGDGIARIRQMKALEQLAETDAPLVPMDARAVALDAAEATRFPVKIEGSAMVLADEALHSVFENLIGNAKLHSGADRMAIDIREKGDTVSIAFSDRGKGVPEKDRDRLFTEGYVLGQSGNTGLGLYIAKETVERYGGTITYEVAEPQGATFIITMKNAKQ